MVSYIPNKVKRRRHSWANNLGRKLVLLGVQGSHTEMFLCEIPMVPAAARPRGPVLKRVWRSQPGACRVLGWRKHYFLDLPGTHSPWGCSSRSMTGCTVKGAKLMEIV